MEITTKSYGRKIFVDHGEAYGNLGDEAMLISALRRLSKHLGPCVFVIPREGNRPIPNLEEFSIVTTPSPYSVFKAVVRLLNRYLKHCIKFLPGGRVPLKSFHMWATFLDRMGILRITCPDYRRFLGDLAECDAFYGVGAADFNDFNSIGAIYKCWLYKLASRKTSICVVSAQGFGPLNSPGLDIIMFNTFNQLRALAFRDAEFSTSFCRKLGPLSCRMEIVGDEAFSLQAADMQRCEIHLKEAGLKPGEAFIAIHWRATDYTSETNRLYPKIANLYDAVVEKTDLKLLFIPMSYDVHSRIDQDCYAEIRNMMKHPENICILEPTRDTGLIKGIIGLAQLTLGLSYHVHVFGLSQKVPAIIIFSGQYYYFKSHGLVDFYGAPNAAHDIEESNVMEVLLTVMHCLADRKNTSKSIDEVNVNLLKKNDWSIELVAKLLKERDIE